MIELFEDTGQTVLGYRVRHLDIDGDIPATLGKWLLEHELYSSGNDFTNSWAEDPDYKGNSVLKSIWSGNPSRKMEGMVGMGLWLITKGDSPVGVAAWAKTTTCAQVPLTWVDEVPRHMNHHPKKRLPVGLLGHVMCYLKQEHRGLGLMKTALKQMAPSINAMACQAKYQGLMPFLAASDATHFLMEPLTDTPLADTMQMSRKLRQDIWSKWNELNMFHKEDSPQADFLVEPEPWVNQNTRKRPKI